MRRIQAECWRRVRTGALWSGGRGSWKPSGTTVSARRIYAPIRSWWWQGLWNIASPGLRAHKVEVLREVAETLDIDGIQIDFARHIPCLPPGRQWEMRDHATEFLRMLRRMLNDAGRRRNRRLQLAAKVPGGWL